MIVPVPSFEPPIEVPGVLWPIATDGDETYPWVERDDEAALFPDDIAARDALWAALVAQGLRDDFIAGHAMHPSLGRPCPYVRPVVDEDRSMARRYTEVMASAEVEWRPVLDALREAGAVNPGVEQTGGMCLALGFEVEEGCPLQVILTGADGPIASTREEERDSVAWIDGPPVCAVSVYVGLDQNEPASEDYETFPGDLATEDPAARAAVARDAVRLGRRLLAEARKEASGR